MEIKIFFYHIHSGILCCCSSQIHFCESKAGRSCFLNPYVSLRQFIYLSTFISEFSERAINSTAVEKREWKCEKTHNYSHLKCSGEYSMKFPLIYSSLSIESTIDVSFFLFFATFPILDRFSHRRKCENVEMWKSSISNSSRQQLHDDRKGYFFWSFFLLTHFLLWVKFKRT